MGRWQGVRGLRHEFDLEIECNAVGASRTGTPVRQIALRVVLDFQKIREILKIVVQQSCDIVALAQAAPQNAVNGELALEDANLLQLHSELEHPFLVSLLMLCEPHAAVFVEWPRQTPARTQSQCISRPQTEVARSRSLPVSGSFSAVADLPREAIAVALHRENQGLRFVIQYRAQLGNAARDDRFGHDATRPDAVHQVILVDQFAG